MKNSRSSQLRLGWRASTAQLISRPVLSIVGIPTADTEVLKNFRAIK